jgi:hypothetical protein
MAERRRTGLDDARIRQPQCYEPWPVVMDQTKDKILARAFLDRTWDRPIISA